MNFPTAYTALESLLLFQALRVEGPHAHAVFNKISEQLKSIPLVQSHPTFDSGRLSPDALRELYLWLLKEEAKSDLQQQLDGAASLQNGDGGGVETGSRKRKAPSPSLPTVLEASKHAHLIPRLVGRLYARYREHTVREIREHEQRYETASRDIGDIEAGNWDERFQKQRNGSATQSPEPASPAKIQSASTQPDRATTASPTSPEATTDTTSQVTSKPYTENKIDALINHESEPQNGVHDSHSRSASITALPSLQQMAPRSPQLGIPPKIPIHGHGPPFSHSPTNSLHSPFQPNPIPPSLNSPQVQGSLSRPSSSSSRPILPPPAGMKLPPVSPVQNIGSPGVHGPPLGQPPYPPPQAPNPLSTGFSPTNAAPIAYPPHQQAPPAYYPNQPYLDRRSSYPPPQQQINPSYPHPSAHPSAGYQQLPPFTPSQQENLNQHLPHQHADPTLQRNPSLAQAGPQTYPGYAATAPPTSTRPTRPSNPRLVTDIIAALATPPRRPVWKSERPRPDIAPIKTGTPVPRPDVEPLSPVLKRSEPMASRTTRATRNRGATVTDVGEELEALPMPTRTRGRRKRENSIVSSTADESHMTRSQSVSTTAGPDRPMSRGNVKIEPSTPADEMDTPHDAPSGGRVTRTRRGTLQTQSSFAPQQHTSKRKRQPSVSNASEGDVGTPPPRPTTVLATRNFHKISATILDDINSHKFASIFKNPVKETDAPGYDRIIKIPQNLKSLRLAISKGMSFLKNIDSVDGGASEGGYVELERSEEVIPPLAIVNASQLEKEVLRMFANAVMFNPGEDGVVSDTREMCEDVGGRMAEWRGVDMDRDRDRDREREEEVEEGKGKRRKL